MKYVLLIHQGTTPLPGTEAWEKLSENEQKQVYADYGDQQDARASHRETRSSARRRQRPPSASRTRRR